MLNVSNISKSYSSNRILDDVSFCVNDGDKIAIVGLNGAGKSTLLSIIMGNIDFNDGQISGVANMAFMPQTIGEMNLSENIAALDFIETGRPIKELQNKISSAYINGDIDAASDTEEILQRYSPYTAESEMYKLISGFGIPEEWLNKPIRSLSGGQKSKVAFARVLYSVYDLLLLDEPTNHLDKHTKDWVMSHIKSLSKPVVFISHDEKFLQNVANKILYLDSQTHHARLFNCNYKSFLKQKEDIADALEKQAKNQQREIKKLQDFIENADNTRKHQAISREKTLIKLQKNEIKLQKEKREIQLNLHPNETERGNPIIAENLYFSYGKAQKLIRNTNFALASGERFIVIGKNGTGKSTLLKLMAGILSPDRGHIKKGNKTTIGYYAQEHETINLNNTAMEEIDEIAVGLNDTQKRGFLASFNFGENDIYRKIKTFSPGERSRLSMAKLCLTGANLLLLDEPTNHLDVPTKEVIAKTLNNYGGTMIIVSHDIDFLKHMDITRMFVLPDCKTRLYNLGELTQYQENE